MLWVQTADSQPSKQIGLVLADIYAAGIVECLAHLDAAREQILAGSFDVGNDQVQPLRRARRSRGDILAEDHRACGTWRRKLDHAVVAAGREVGIEPPAEFRVKLLCTVDVRDGNDNHLELHVDGLYLRI